MALLPLLAVSLAGTTVICCIGMLVFPGNAPLLLLQHSQHAAPSRPTIRVLACDPLSHQRAAFKERGHCSRIALLYQSNLDHRGDGTGSGHRGNRKTALEMVGCEVVMTTGTQQCATPPPPLLLHCPPAERETERGRVEMELSSKQGGRENVCCNGVCMCVCVSFLKGRSQHFVVLAG